MKSFKKAMRIVALLLSVTMTVTFMPVSAFAETNAAEESILSSVSGGDTEEEATDEVLVSSGDNGEVTAVVPADTESEEVAEDIPEATVSENEAEKTYSPITDADFLKADGRNLKNANGAIVNLRGTNAGGYLVQEFWMTPTAASANVKDQKTIMEYLEGKFGTEKMYELLDVYETAYWTEQDFKNIADLGLNTVRLPFWWRNLADASGNWYGYDASAQDPYAKAFERMDWFVENAAKYGLYVVLDFHGAPGSQNGSDHSGVDGEDDKVTASEFWFGSNALANQELFYDMIDVISERYKNNAAVAGYDLLNEPYCTYRYNSPNGLGADALHDMLWDVYDKAYDRIRENGDDHVVIMEATWDPVDLPNPAVYDWSNVMYEYHNYNYGDYDNEAGQQISSMSSKLNNIKNADYDVPSYMGEFCFFNNPSAWDQGLELMTTAGLNWTTWTYKTIDYYGMWGIYHHPVSMDNGINLETSSFEQIKDAWSKVSTDLGSINSELAPVVEKWARAEVYESTLGASSEAIDASKEYYFQFTNTQDILGVSDGKAVAGSAVNGFFIESNSGKVALKDASTGKYLRVDAETKSLVADAESAENAEKFLLSKIAPMALALKSSTTGLYVAQDKESGAIYANSQTTLGQTTFQLRAAADGSLYNEADLGRSTGWTKYETLEENIHGGAVDRQGFYSDGIAAGQMENSQNADDDLGDWSGIKYVDYNVNVEKAGEYTLVICYNGDDDKTVLVRVGDEEAKELSVPAVDPSHAWDKMHTRAVSVNLKAGDNTIKVSGTMNGGWINLDCVYLSDYPVVTQANGASRYEGEYFFATGYETSGGSHYSNGQARGGLNQDIELAQFNADWSNVRHTEYTVYAEKDGTYTVYFGYDGNSKEGMTVAYRVNDGENKTLTVDASGWSSAMKAAFEVELTKGFNTIFISGTIGNSDDWANNDYIDVVLKGSEIEIVEMPKAISGFTRYEGEVGLKRFNGAGLEEQSFFSFGSAISGMSDSNVHVSDIASDWSNIKYATLTYNAIAAGTYRFLIGYNGDDDKVMAVKVGDGEVKEVSVPAVLSTHNWDVMHEVLVTLELEEGENTIYFSGALGGGWMNIDYVDVSNYPVFIDENGVERYEMESHTSVSGEDFQHQDFYSGIEELNGRGGMSTNVKFTIGDDILSSKLRYVDYSVFAEKEGYYDITVDAIGNGADMTCAYQVNDKPSENFYLYNAGQSWNHLVYQTIHVYLNKGYNQVIISGAYNGDWINYDYIDVVYSDTQEGEVIERVPAISGWTRLEGEADAELVNGGSTEEQSFYSYLGAISRLSTDDVKASEVEDDLSNIPHAVFTINAPFDGTYRFHIGYNGDDDKEMVYKVNDGDVVTLAVPAVLDTHNWDVMHEINLELELKAGDNTLALSGALGGGWMNIDYVDVANAPVTVLEDGSERYEAEDFNCKSANTPSAEHQGFYSGLANNNGVGGMGATYDYLEGSEILGTTMNYIDYSIFVKEAGEYTITVAGNGNGADMTCVYELNGAASETFVLENAGYSWDHMVTAAFTVELVAGYNRLVLAGTYSGDWLNYDYIDVKAVSGGDEEPVEDGDDTVSDGDATVSDGDDTVSDGDATVSDGDATVSDGDDTTPADEEKDDEEETKPGNGSGSGSHNSQSGGIIHTIVNVIKQTITNVVETARNIIRSIVRRLPATRRTVITDDAAPLADSAPEEVIDEAADEALTEEFVTEDEAQAEEEAVSEPVSEAIVDDAVPTAATSSHRGILVGAIVVCGIAAIGGLGFAGAKRFGKKKD
ncbi:MAG: cellulase family glycosylhydrolase [Lachnospiraceae bacterium]|nr:cellulase family glycosylhydrolase [Lachnospiraceae bacterium]